MLIAEDHGLVRAGFRALLESIEGIEVVGEASNGAEALERIGALKPDLVLMDISMPGLNGLEATRRVAKLKPRPRVLVLSMHDENEYVRQAFNAGASGYLLKSAGRTELESAVAAVVRGDTWLSPGLAHELSDDATLTGPLADPLKKLTPRQREVLQLVAEGHSTKSIAHRLSLSVKTVETHRAQIMERLEVHHIAGLVRYAIRADLVPPEK